MLRPLDGDIFPPLRLNLQMAEVVLLLSSNADELASTLNPPFSYLKLGGWSMGSLNIATVKADHGAAINPPCPVPRVEDLYD